MGILEYLKEINGYDREDIFLANTTNRCCCCDSLTTVYVIHNKDYDTYFAYDANEVENLGLEELRNFSDGEFEYFHNESCCGFIYEEDFKKGDYIVKL